MGVSPANRPGSSSSWSRTSWTVRIPARRERSEQRWAVARRPANWASGRLDAALTVWDGGAETGSRTLGLGNIGELGKLRGEMSPGETVSKPGSARAPYLASAGAPQLGMDGDLNRCRGRVPALLGPRTCPTRSVYLPYSARVPALLDPRTTRTLFTYHPYAARVPAVRGAESS